MIIERRRRLKKEATSRQLSQCSSRVPCSNDRIPGVSRAYNQNQLPEQRLREEHSGNQISRTREQSQLRRCDADCSQSENISSRTNIRRQSAAACAEG